MARPPLPLGTCGEIRTYAWLDDKWVACRTLPGDAPKAPRYRARASYRATNGTTRDIERVETTAAKAIRALRAAVTALTGDANGGLTASSRVRDAIPLYLALAQLENKDTTYDRYETVCRLYVEPYLGALLIRECTAGRINQALDKIRADHDEIAAAYLRFIKSRVAGVLQIAIDHDVVSVNAAKEVRRIKGGPKRKAHAFDPEQLLDFLAKVDGDPQSRKYDLPDLIRFLFGTGVRIGEALALRWSDCNLTDDTVWITNPDDGTRKKVPPRSIWINGNIVAVKGKGLQRHSGKTFASARIVGLPAFLHTLLLVRCPVLTVAGTGTLEPVFPSGTLSWRHPSNVQRSIRRLRERISYPKFVTHIGRKTVATALSQAGHTSRQVADQLGQANSRTTEQHYIEKGLGNPGAAADIDALHRRTG